MVRSRTEPRPQLPQRADPLTGMHDVADAVVTLIGRAEVRVTAEHRIMKKTGAPVCTDAPVCDQTLYELPVDAAFGIVYDLFDFKFVIGHRAKSFLNETMETVLQMTKNKIIIVLYKGSVETKFCEGKGNHKRTCYAENCLKIFPYFFPYEIG